MEVGEGAGGEEGGGRRGGRAGGREGGGNCSKLVVLSCMDCMVKCMPGWK